MNRFRVQLKFKSLKRPHLLVQLHNSQGAVLQVSQRIMILIPSLSIIRNKYTEIARIIAQFAAPLLLSS